MAAARKAVPAETVLMGNVNPSDPLVFGTPEQVDATARKVIEDTAGQGLFLSSGCAMGRNTPPENVMPAGRRCGKIWNVRAGCGNEFVRV